MMRLEKQEWDFPLLHQFRVVDHRREAHNAAEDACERFEFCCARLRCANFFIVIVGENNLSQISENGEFIVTKRKRF